jgi:hypothetical protein
MSILFRHMHFCPACNELWACVRWLCAGEDEVLCQPCRDKHHLGLETRSEIIRDPERDSRQGTTGNRCHLVSLVEDKTHGDDPQWRSSEALAESVIKSMKTKNAEKGTGRSGEGWDIESNHSSSHPFWRTELTS